MRKLIGWTIVGLSGSLVGPASAKTTVERSARQPTGPSEIPVRNTLTGSTVLGIARGTAAQRPVTTSFEIYKRSLGLRAIRDGVSGATVRRLLPGLQSNQRAMELDHAQRPAAPGLGGAPPLSPYLREHVSQSLISRGRARYYNLWPKLLSIHKRYGVDPAVAMAIYGKETSYGRFSGNFDLLEVLASLAYEGRRRELFETEFIAALKLIEAGLPRERLKGSYAGATGYPQFMPSVMRSMTATADVWCIFDNNAASAATRNALDLLSTFSVE